MQQKTPRAGRLVFLVRQGDTDEAADEDDGGETDEGELKCVERCAENGCLGVGPVPAEIRAADTKQHRKPDDHQRRKRDEHPVQHPAL